MEILREDTVMKYVAVIMSFTGMALCFTGTGGASLVPDAELGLRIGGAVGYCSTPVDDPDRPDCNECTPDGNGHFVKCVLVAKSEVHLYVPLQVPATIIDYNVIECGGKANRYNDNICTDQWYQNFDCGRDYSKPGTPTTSTAVACVELEP